jgi:peptidoglycan/xylan/chitin deacetylase (PgdA/CDA1 family)
LIDPLVLKRGDPYNQELLDTRKASNSPWRRAVAPARLALYLSGLHAIPRRLGAVRGCAVLMYHSVSETLAARRYPYAVTPARFESHLRFLRRRGIPILPLADVAENIRAGRPFKRLAAAISFDDGWRDNFTAAYPLLLKYSAPATFFVTADWVGRAEAPIPALADIRIPGGAMIGWDVLRKAADEGLASVGSHGRTHAPLTTLAPEDVRKEVFESKRIIEDGLGRSVSLFSYPAGAVDGSAMDRVREAGFRAAFTSLPRAVRTGNDPYALGRFDAARYAAGKSPKLAGLLNISYLAAVLSLGR